MSENIVMAVMQGHPPTLTEGGVMERGMVFHPESAKAQLQALLERH